MAEMPNFRAIAYANFIIHIARWMHVIYLAVIHNFSKHFDVVLAGKVFRHVLRVEYCLGVLLDEFVVNITVGRCDNYEVAALKQFGCQGLFALVHRAMFTELGYVGVKENGFRTFLAQFVYDTDGGRLAIVVDVLLIGYAEYENLGTVERFLEAAVEHITCSRHAIFRHTVVHHHRCLNHRRMEAILTSFPTEVVWVKRYAMTTKSRTRIERCETKRLCLRSLNHLPQIDVHTVAEHGKLVYQSDVDVSVGVLKYLCHFCHGRR